MAKKTTEKITDIKIDCDAQWKEIIKTFFYPMLQSLMPALAQDMDRSREVEYLEQELIALTAAIGGPKQRADILAKVPMKRGGDIWLALHIEVQGAKGGNLPERMFYYNSSLRLKHLKKSRRRKKKGEQETSAASSISDVVSLAILTAPRPLGEAEFYERKSYDNELCYKYPAIKLWELDSKALEESANPFDCVLLAGLGVIKSGSDDVSRVSHIKALGEVLDAKGWSEDEKYSLFRFTEAILFPKSAHLQMEYRDWVEKKRKEAEKVYISVAERIGIEEGIKQGLEQGLMQKAKQTALRMLERGFDIPTVSDLADMPEEHVRELAKEVFAACSGEAAEGTNITSDK